MLASTDDFTSLLAGYETIALVANSEDVDIEKVKAALPASTLFVFFTGCAKVLPGPFDRDAALCHRLVDGGKRFLKSQRVMDIAHGLFPNGLKAEVGLLAERGQPDGTATSPISRNSDLVPYTIDFDHQFGVFYPVEKMPTTGFALAVWLLQRAPEARVCLCGFTGVAGTEFNIFSGHDWTFEQIVLSLFERDGRLDRISGKGERTSTSFERISARFPQFDKATVALVAGQVLSNRFGGLERQMAKVWATTKLKRQFASLVRRLRG